MTPDYRYDFVSILRSRAGDLLLEEMMEDIPTGALTVCGERVLIDTNRLGERVQEALDRFHVKPHLQPAKLGLSKAEQREFVRTHDVVMITRDRSVPKIEVEPMYRATSGGWLPSGSPILLEGAEVKDPKEIAAAVLRAFKTIDIHKSAGRKPGPR